MFSMHQPDLSRIEELEPKTLGADFPVRRAIIETTLYSAYLVPVQGGEGPPYDILVIEHPPAAPASAFLWCRRIHRTGTKTEIVREITRAIEHQRKRQKS